MEVSHKRIEQVNLCRPRRSSDQRSVENISSGERVEPATKKFKSVLVDQCNAPSNDPLHPKALLACHLCGERVHRVNLQLHLDMKCPMASK